MQLSHDLASHISNRFCLMLLDFVERFFSHFRFGWPGMRRRKLVLVYLSVCQVWMNRFHSCVLFACLFCLFVCLFVFHATHWTLRSGGDVRGPDRAARVRTDDPGHQFRALLRHLSAVQGRLHLHQEPRHVHLAVHLDLRRPPHQVSVRQPFVIASQQSGFGHPVTSFFLPNRYGSTEYYWVHVAVNRFYQVSLGSNRFQQALLGFIA